MYLLKQFTNMYFKSSTTLTMDDRTTSGDKITQSIYSAILTARAHFNLSFTMTIIMGVRSRGAGGASAPPLKMHIGISICKIDAATKY